MSRELLAWPLPDFSADVERRADGTVLLRPRLQLAPYPDRVTDALAHWATRTPQQTFIARRGSDGEWSRLSYAATLLRVQMLAAGLAGLGLSAERPIAILSGNSIEHMLLGLAAMHIGVPYSPVSVAYSQASSDLGKLRDVMALLTPGLIAAFGTGAFARAISVTAPADALLLGDELAVPGRVVQSLAALEAAGAVNPAAAAVANERVGPDTIAKFLLTSGSTGQPKAVITTQRMLCSNQVMIRQALPFAATDPPVLVDWLPWNHTFGGSHNVGYALFNGGTLYIDDGKPTSGGIGITIRNLREIAPTVYFNVPKGFDLLAHHMHQDPQLRSVFYSRLRACFFGGAGITQKTWDALDTHALATVGARVPIISGLGATETAPSVTFTIPGTERAGVIGVPAAGNEVKLAPVAGKLELRVRGPHVTPGYWRQPELTAQAFDEEGYYRLGDAVRPLDESDPARGLLFDGRISEDFKLNTGTWVSVGPLRSALLLALAPLVQDVVIAGLNCEFIGLLVLPDWRACAEALGIPGTPTPAALAMQPALQDLFRQRLTAYSESHPASSMAVRRAVLLVEPASLDHGEITDKGSVNQRAMLQRRARDVEALYLAQPPPEVLIIA